MPKRPPPPESSSGRPSRPGRAAGYFGLHQRHATLFHTNPGRRREPAGPIQSWAGGAGNTTGRWRRQRARPLPNCRARTSGPSRLLRAGPDLHVPTLAPARSRPAAPVCRQPAAFLSEMARCRRRLLFLCHRRRRFLPHSQRTAPSSLERAPCARFGRMGPLAGLGPSKPGRPQQSQSPSSSSAASSSPAPVAREVKREWPGQGPSWLRPRWRRRRPRRSEMAPAARSAPLPSDQCK